MMPDSIPSSTLEKFTTFGDLLRYLRRRAGLTQLELSIAVGYSDPHISRLEQNMRLPDIPTIQARFIAPLYLEDEPQAVARLLELAAEVRREDAPSPGLCPYKGMDFFDEADADLFVGREVLTEKLVNEVLQLVSAGHSGSGRFLAVVGASGSGKSSLVRAGLVPAFRWNKISGNWPIHILTPTANPLESLAASLAPGSSIASAAVLMDDLARDRRTLSLFVKHQWKAAPGSYLLLIIDQFEEVFSLCRSGTERSIFIDNLLTAAFDADARVIVIIALRADFYAYCAGYPTLRKALASHQEYIGAMNDAEMLRAVEEPARRGHWEFEPGLVDVIMHDVGHEPGALPLLSHALLETWQRRRGRKLTLSGYTSSGGVRGAISETAEAVFTDQFNPEQQAIARRIFLRLTEPGDETAAGDTRRRATFNELVRRPEETDATLAVLKALADARLVTTCDDWVQVAHEALIREWRTLRGWLEDNREGLRLHRQLTEATQEWMETGREPDLLFRGVRLAQAREWANSHAEDMNAQERQFLVSSIESGEREAAEREAAHQRELEAAQKLAFTERLRAEEGVRSTQRLKRRAILLGAVCVIASILAILALFAWRHSSSQAALNRSLSLAAVAEKLNTTGQGDLALLLALEAVKSGRPPAEVLAVLRSVATGFGTRAVLTGHDQAVRAIAISPDTRSVFSGSCARMDAQGSCIEGELALWDLESREALHRWPGHGGWVNRVAFSLDGQVLISGAEDGSLILWDLSGRQVRELKRQWGAITGLVVVPITGNLLTGSADGSLTLWDLKTGDQVRSYDGISSPVTALAVARETLTAVSSHSDGSLMVWDLDNPRHRKKFLNQGLEIRAVAISSDASRIIFSNIVAPDVVLRIIDGASGEMLGENIFGCVPVDLALDNNDSYVLSACSHSVLRVNLQGLNIQAISIEAQEVQSAVTISPNGRLGISASEDGTIRVLNMGYLDSETLTFETEGMTAIAADPTGAYLLLNDASRNGYNQPVLWDIAEKKVIRKYSGFDAGVSPGGAAISPDNRFVAVAGVIPGTGMPAVMMWERESGVLLCQKFEGLSENGRALAFSPDSRYLLVGSQVLNGTGGHLILYETRSCSIVRVFDTTEEVSSVRISADGTRALTGSSLLGRAILWDVATGREIRRFSAAHSSSVLTVVFGPGETTVLGSGVGELYLWNLKSESPVRSFIGSQSFPFCLAISPDGKYVLSGGISGDVNLWNFATGKKLDQQNLNTAVFSVAFSPDSQYAYAVSEYGELLVWPVAEKTLPELLQWISANRYVREFSCEERSQYQVEPLCKP